MKGNNSLPEDKDCKLHRLNSFQEAPNSAMHMADVQAENDNVSIFRKFLSSHNIWSWTFNSSFLTGAIDDVLSIVLTTQPFHL